LIIPDHFNKILKGPRRHLKTRTKMNTRKPKVNQKVKTNESHEWRIARKFIAMTGYLHGARRYRAFSHNFTKMPCFHLSACISKHHLSNSIDNYEQTLLRSSFMSSLVFVSIVILFWSWSSLVLFAFVLFR
jgi:hypothetical protein